MAKRLRLDEPPALIATLHDARIDALDTALVRIRCDAGPWAHQGDAAGAFPAVAPVPVALLTRLPR
jgi:hypothetical protein